MAHEMGHILAAAALGASGRFTLVLAIGGGLADLGNAEEMSPGRFRWVTLAGYAAEILLAVVLVGLCLAYDLGPECWFILAPWWVLTLFSFRSDPNDIDYFRIASALAAEQGRDS